MNTVDLSELAEKVSERRELRNAGLKRLAQEIMGWEMEKPRSVAKSRWDDDELSDDQVHYACVDAFVSFMIGWTLRANRYA